MINFLRLSGTAHLNADTFKKNKSGQIGFEVLSKAERLTKTFYVLLIDRNNRICRIHTVLEINSSSTNSFGEGIL